MVSHLNLSMTAWRRACAAAHRPVRDIHYEILSRWLGCLEYFAPASTVRSLAEVSLFIVGHWRSGTTLLHELVCADDDVAYPTTAACMNPQSFLLAPHYSPSEGRRISRPMDRVQITAASPQEDEFALFLLGAPSPYALLLYPELLGAVPKLSAIDTFGNDDRELWLATAQRFYNAVAAAVPGKPIVIKSPPHSFRIAALARAYPNAKFLHVVRDPYCVFSSTRKLWQKMWELYALSEPLPDDEIDVAIARTMALLDDAVASGFAGLAPERYATVRYEDVLGDPAGTLATLGRNLALPYLQSCGSGRSRFMESMASYRRNIHSLTDNDRAIVERHCHRLLKSYPGEIS